MRLRSPLAESLVHPVCSPGSYILCSMLDRTASVNVFAHNIRNLFAVMVIAMVITIMMIIYRIAHHKYEHTFPARVADGLYLSQTHRLHVIPPSRAGQFNRQLYCSHSRSHSRHTAIIARRYSYIYALRDEHAKYVRTGCDSACKCKCCDHGRTYLCMSS